MMSKSLATIVMVLFAATHLPAADPPGEPPRVGNASRSAARAAATEKRRTWLLGQIRKRAENAAELAEWTTRVQAMSGAEVEQAADAMLDVLGSDDADAGQRLLELARQDQARHEAERRAAVESQAGLVEDMRARQVAAYAGRAYDDPGFRPVIASLPGIGWYPSGASLTASATVLPGGRVRVGVAPFFSSVGSVYSYSYGVPYAYASWCGPYYQYPAYGQNIYIERYLNFGGGHRGHHVHHRGGRAGPWHDGLRTRVGPRPH